MSRPSLPVASVLLAASLSTSIAQRPPSSPLPVPTSDLASTRFQIPHQDAANCPVGFSVRRSFVVEQRRVGEQSTPRNAQSIELAFDSDRRITDADVLVHVLTGGPALMLLRTPDRPPNTESRSFHLALTHNPRPQHLVLQQITGVLSVDLTAMHFANGETWRAADNTRCRAVPDLFQPVTAEQQ